MTENSLKNENLTALNNLNTLTEQEGSRPETTEVSPRPKREPKYYMAPLKGYEWNPLLKLPRNSKCPCKSGKKFKACCLQTLPKAITSKLAADYKVQMLQPDLVFITKTNEEQLKAMIPPEVWEAKQEELKKLEESLKSKVENEV